MKRKIGVLLLIVSLLAGCSVSVITYPRYGSLEAFLGVPKRPNIPAPQDVDLMVEPGDLEIMPLNYEREHLHPLKDAKVIIGGVPGQTDDNGILRMYGIPVGWQEIIIEHNSLRGRSSGWLEIHEGRNHPRNIVHEGIGHYLIIGIENYTDGRLHTPGAREDAQAVYEAFKNSGNSLYADYRLLLDGEATRKNIEDMIRGFVKESNPDDYIVIYFTGKIGEDYLSPYDGIYDGPWEREITDGALRSWFSEFKGDVTLILEGSDSGTFFDGSINPYALDTSPLAFKGSDYTVIASSKKGMAHVNQNTAQAIFTQHLIDGICRKNADFNGDKVITAREIFEYAKRKVRNDNWNFGGQVPVMWPDWENSNVIYRYRY